MKAFKFEVITIQNWKMPVTEVHCSFHKTLEQAEKQIELEKRSGLKVAKIYKTTAPQNTFRIQEI